MPTKNKILLTVLVIIVSTLLASFEYLEANIPFVWIIAIIMFLMIVGLWVFPEANGKINQEK